ncbi:hypothetical protein SpCBS45565_g07173 [Spizellomyces sp. 'palustris']|nr:hypothetical protein SpCBS45565_g07173 [Spizellomyces sp. 'palustris']
MTSQRSYGVHPSSRNVRGPVPTRSSSPPESIGGLQDQGHDFTFVSPQKPAKKFSNRIEDYELKEMLGRGGFGFVHKAVSKSKGTYGREVAIKMIDKRLMKAANMTRRVANEVEIHWQLHHPSILELYNYFEDQSYVYLVMELCQNGELYRYIHQRKCPLTEPEARGVMAQIVRGLLYLHANGIIHRDLKLSNLLLTDNFDVKIADFGLAVKLNDPEGEQKTMCGTPNYISPEIVSRQPYGLTSDVWSLGCMIVTILTGTPPFESKAVKNTLDRVSRVDYSLPDSLSAHAKDLVHRLLQKDPKRRLALTKVLSHPFFNPTLPVSSLRPLSPVFDSTQRRRSPLREVTRQPTATNSSGAAPGSSDVLTERVGFKENQRPTPSEGDSRAKRGRVRAPTRAEQEDMVDHRPLKENAVNGRDGYRGSSTSSPLSGEAGESGNSPRHRSSDGSRTISSELHNTRYSRSDVPELPAFSTVRLKSLRQKTKHGNVSILETGELLLDFIGEEYLMLISSDSNEISLFDRSVDPLNSSARPVQTFERATLPPGYVKKYRYGSRFVELVRSKTPKIIFYSPQAKCILMENAPLADFEMVFYNGTRAHYSVSRGMMEVRLSRGDSEGRESAEVHQIRLPSPSVATSTCETLDIPSHVAPVVRHVQECLKQCMDVERSGKLDSTTRYPVILKSSHCRIVSGVSGGRDGDRREADSFHPSAMSTYTRSGSSGAVASTRNGNTPRQGINAGASDNWPLHGDYDGRPVQSGTMQSPMGEKVGQTARHDTYKPSGQRSHQNRGGIVSAATSSVGRPPQAPVRAAASDTFAIRKAPANAANAAGEAKMSSGASASGASGELNFQFLANVGWCMKTTEGKFVMLFGDGVRMVVDPRDQTLEWAEADRTEQDGTKRFQIDKHLPDYAKTKLAHFPQFLQLAGFAGAHGSGSSTGGARVPTGPRGGARGMR